MKKKRSIIFQYLFFFGLGIFLIWWSVKDIDEEKWTQISLSLKNARFYLIGPVFFILISSHYIRALRWRLLIESLGYKPSKANIFFSVMIGYLANQAFPRLGEVLKCTVLARYEKLPADKLIGTIILERLIDTLCLLIVFVITIGIQPDLYSQISQKIFNPSTTIEEDQKFSVLFLTIIIAAIVFLAIITWMIFKKKNFTDLLVVFKKIGSRIWQGLSAVRHLKKRWEFMLLTVLLWLFYLAGGYVGFLAFRETDHYGIKEAFTVLSAGSIGMVVTPGGIGAYAYLIKGTMELYGLKESIALAFGWILWIAQIIVILLGGLLSFMLLPWYNKKRVTSPG